MAISGRKIKFVKGNAIAHTGKVNQEVVIIYCSCLSCQLHFAFASGPSCNPLSVLCFRISCPEESKMKWLAE